uniref:G-protein coupled receptors family 1 profile domain-containing protein n=1 Tax=Anopheles melas TaxID=34690 RepID=A0A182UBV8_9DIPT
MILDLKAMFPFARGVGWRITVQWHAGNVACKVFLFMRAFCLYLSSNVLVCVSLDRCFAVIYPLRVSAARKRGKIMLGGAWFIAFVNAMPQSIIFRVQQHPQVPGFTQCVTFGFFATPGLETAYNLFCVIAMYFLPLMIISGAYTVILCEISNRSREKETSDSNSTGTMRLRCNDLTHIERARQRTLRLTITIVVVFVWCWTPYVVMTLWYMFDRESAAKVDVAVQDGLFLMAVSNSCMNPLVYGSYAMKCRLPCRRRNTLGGAQTPNAAQRRSTGTYGWWWDCMRAHVLCFPIEQTLEFPRRKGRGHGSRPRFWLLCVCSDYNSLSWTRVEMPTAMGSKNEPSVLHEYS